MKTGLTSLAILPTFQSEFGKVIVKKHRSDIEVGKILARPRKSDNNVTECCGYYSTIHSAKGLEATCVLMVADTSNILMKWLETDKKKLRTKSDEYRLGYVGFSRARELLCIGCLEEITDKQIQILERLNVKIE
ncbi:3'-5' exonuclease [Thermoanaerobacterium sp. DL9XJH110]|uniref:3'-5' exonuclease n=1 Tax=Thermoanaerobacterium sp. DL9XJH110 TaxID=3386643 RepID=UPI003BB579F1